MKSFYLNQENGDTKLNELHDIEEITGKEELEQAIWMRLKTNRGEWPFDTNYGYPWLELFRKKAPKDEFKTALIETVYQEERIREIIRAEIKVLDRDKRKLNIYFEVVTTEGLIKSTGEVQL